MKKLLIIPMFVFTAQLYAQTQGISYQAVIVNKQAKEIPGVDLEGTYLPNSPLTVRFTILNQSDATDYQEEQKTSTDEYGMINLTIGQGTPTAASPSIFSEIDWDGTPKNLRVEISLGEASDAFTELSLQQLTFVPYAFHRNITATGTLTVDGKATFNGESEFTDLTVLGTTNLGGTLNVNNGSPTNLTGNLTVTQSTTLNDSLTVNAISALNGQVTINADVNGSDTNYDAYPLRVEGSNQGVAIKVDGSRNTSNNFVTFIDGQGIQGRIEGQTNGELLVDPEYIFDNSVLVAQEAIAVTNQVASDASTTFCAGVGACETVPVPSLIIASAANLVVQTAQIVGYNAFRQANIGVTYQSGGADYAEWLPKENTTDKFYPGDIVGIRNGMVSKQTEESEYVMVISHLPIVLGNIPEEGNESQFEKIAFMGQVPVKVIGTVNPGDYVLPSGGNNGFGVGKRREDMEISDYKKIVGVAWSGASGEGFNLVNVAVGLNANDMSQLVRQQQDQIDVLEAEVRRLKELQSESADVLAELVPGYAAAMEKRASPATVRVLPKPEPVPLVEKMINTQIINQDQSITYHDIGRDKMLAGFDMARKIMREKGVDVEHHPFFSRMNTDPVYREEVINRMMDSIRKQLGRSLKNDQVSN